MVCKKKPFASSIALPEYLARPPPVTQPCQPAHDAIELEMCFWSEHKVPQRNGEYQRYSHNTVTRLNLLRYQWLSRGHEHNLGMANMQTKSKTREIMK